MIELLERVNGFVWGIPALILILGVGLYLSVRSGFVQMRLFPAALRSFIQQFNCRGTNKDSISPYRSLCTALAATVGTGNIAGVAGAICIGGPGAVFWMWVCALLGMVIKFTEAVLAVHFREKDKNGMFFGGPMQYIVGGMGKSWAPLAYVYSFFGVVASFGVGNATQVNAVVDGVNSVLHYFGGYNTWYIGFSVGVVLSVLITSVLLGGANRIGEIAEKLIPFAAIAYILLGLVVVVMCSDRIPGAFGQIFEGAFSPKAVTGGTIGSAFSALRIGASRGVFTNEAGMGTAAIAHAGADVDHPVKQGMMGIIEVFLDTIIICTVTALVILCSNIPIPFGTDLGATLTTQAFSHILGNWVSIPIALFLCCFAVGTILGWGLYGARCAQFLFGEGAWRKFVFVQAFTVILGSVMQTGTVWLVSETVNGLMAIPNLIALAFLSPTVLKLTKAYKNRT